MTPSTWVSPPLRTTSSSSPPSVRPACCSAGPASSACAGWAATPVPPSANTRRSTAPSGTGSPKQPPRPPLCTWTTRSRTTAAKSSAACSAEAPRSDPYCYSSGGFCGCSRVLLGLEELVHDLGAGGDHRVQFAAVDDFGGAGAGMPGQAGDLLDRLGGPAGNLVELRGFEPLTPSMPWSFVL